MARALSLPAPQPCPVHGPTGPHGEYAVCCHVRQGVRPWRVEHPLQYSTCDVRPGRIWCRLCHDRAASGREDALDLVEQSLSLECGQCVGRYLDEGWIPAAPAETAFADGFNVRHLSDADRVSLSMLGCAADMGAADFRKHREMRRGAARPHPQLRDGEMLWAWDLGWREEAELERHRVR